MTAHIRWIRVSRLCLAGLIVLTASARAGSSFSANYAITTDSVDGGGQQTTSALYRIDASLGGVGGISTNAGSSETMKAGYIGQLTEVTALALTASPAPVNEGAASQLGGVVELDDATVTVLGAADVAWNASAYPIGLISPSGVATTLLVYVDTLASVTGAYLGVTGAEEFLVLDSDSDNFGLYAGDQVPDGWQTRYFGPSNPNGLASATNAAGQSNLYAYTADLNPSNPASRFEIVALSNQGPDWAVYFFPASTGRVYALQYRTDLASGAWTNLQDQTPVSGTGATMFLSDTNTAGTRFYRVKVAVP